MFDTIFGLPLHPLVVHAVVVVAPVAALTVAAAALWPRFRRWAGPLPLLLSATALILVPVAVQSGESLEDRVKETALVERHSDLAGGLLPWAALLTIGAAVLFWLARREARAGRTASPTPPRLAVAALTLVALAGATGLGIQIVRIGHSGSEAAWSEAASNQGN